METIKIQLSREERCLINNMLIENCMGMVDTLREQNTKEGFAKVRQVMDATVSAQHAFFEASLNEEFEIFTPIMQFVKRVLANSQKELDEMKESMVKSGDPNGFKAASIATELGNILRKIPEPSLIALK